MYLEVIILDQLEPSSLMHIQLRLSEDVLKTFMISVDIAHIAEQIMSPCLQSMNNSSEFQVMRWIIHFMLSKLARGISNDLPSCIRTPPNPIPDASQNTSKGFSISGCAKTGAEVRRVRRVWKVASHSGV